MAGLGRVYLGGIPQFSVAGFFWKIYFVYSGSTRVSQFRPLNKLQEMTGEELMRSMREDADEVRKKMKRNTLGKQYGYLKMVQNEAAVLCDAENAILSMSPISNCHETQLSNESKSVLLHVEGCSQTICRDIMEKLVEYLMCNASMSVDELLGKSSRSVLEVNPIRVVEDGNENSLQAMFPSSNDLTDPIFDTERIN